MGKENLQIDINNCNSFNVEMNREEIDKKMNINPGHRLYLKGKYGSYSRVEVISIDGVYVNVKLIDYFNIINRVRLEKLCKEPSQKYREFEEKVKEQIEIEQERLWRFKDGLDFN